MRTPAHRDCMGDSGDGTCWVFLMVLLILVAFVWIYPLLPSGTPSPAVVVAIFVPMLTVFGPVMNCGSCSVRRWANLASGYPRWMRYILPARTVTLVSLGP